MTLSMAMLQFPVSLQSSPTPQIAAYALFTSSESSQSYLLIEQSLAHGARRARDRHGGVGRLVGHSCGLYGCNWSVWRRARRVVGNWMAAGGVVDVELRELEFDVTGLGRAGAGWQGFGTGGSCAKKFGMHECRRVGALLQHDTSRE